MTDAAHSVVPDPSHRRHSRITVGQAAQASTRPCSALIRQHVLQSGFIRSRTAAGLCGTELWAASDILGLLVGRRLVREQGASRAPAYGLVSACSSLMQFVPGANHVLTK